MQPDGAKLLGFLRGVNARVRWIAAARGASLGFGAAIVITLLIGAQPSTALLMGATLAVIGAAIATFDRARDKHATAKLVERRAPQSRNVIVTASELLGAG